MEEDEPVVMSQPIRKTTLYKNYGRTNPYADDAQYGASDDTELEDSVTIELGEPAEPEDAELAVDIYETNDAVIVKTMTAGVKKEDLQISVTRESITIKGRRENESRSYGHNYHMQELYWGSFVRTVELPAEVDIEHATASEHHGLITIKLPKIDKKRQTTLKVQ